MITGHMARVMAMGTTGVTGATDTEVVTEVSVDMDLLVVTFLIPVTAMAKLEDTVVTWKAGMF